MKLLAMNEISIFEEYMKQFSDDVKGIKISCIEECDSHREAFSTNCNIIFYDEYVVKQHKLSQEECFACIAHEIGHIKDSTLRQGKTAEETCLLEYLREFNADSYVSKLKLHKELISALNKLCPNDYLAKMRIKVLEHSQNKNPLRPDTLLLPLLLTRLCGFDEWDGKTYPQADMILYKDGVPWYFEIKCTSKKTKIFGAGTLTEWRCAAKNLGHYFFVIVEMGALGTLPKFIMYSPQELIKYSTIPPFKINFNINEVLSQNISIQEQINNITNVEHISSLSHWKNPRGKNNKKAIHCD